MFLAEHFLFVDDKFKSNSLVEHFHRSLKTSFPARLAGSDWFNDLPLVMLGLWTTPCDETGFSASKAV